MWCDGASRSSCVLRSDPVQVLPSVADSPARSSIDTSPNAPGGEEDKFLASRRRSISWVLSPPRAIPPVTIILGVAVSRGRTHAMAAPASPRNATPTIPSCRAASELPSTLLLSEPPRAPTADAAGHSRGAWPEHLDPSDGVESSPSAARSILPSSRKFPRYKEGREFPALRETR